MNHLKKVQGGVGVCLALALGSIGHAQGILTVTPTRTISTTAGNGAIGYTGDGAAATSATLALPSAVAYDSAGNLYLADTSNHVIRKITTGGTITTIAGTGVEGFSGDGAAATSAQLDTPTGIAVDKSGNIYIADSHNHRIREITGTTISTIAGTGTPSFSGDSGAATSATLNDPTAVAVDLSGNVYIADTNNQRIRKITGTTISTIAGTGEENFLGDAGPATSAALDTPTGVAVDAAGNVYIADRHNQRVREITAGNINTIAGSGLSNLSGGFSGDGASPTAAQLSKPTGVSVDASGNVYIADTGNQRIREVGNGAIATVLGSGQQGFGGDGTTPASANLNLPKSVAVDTTGNLAVADKLNERTRSAALPTFAFGSSGVGVTSTPQSATLSNTGTGSLTTTPTYTGPFATAAGGTCPAAPITLAPGASCTINIAYVPASAGAASGNVTFGGTGVVPNVILLTGTGTQTATTTTLTTTQNPTFVTQAVTFTATVKVASPASGVPAPSGNVNFLDGATLLAAVPVSPTTGAASYTTSALAAATHNITAVYVGDANYTTSSSGAIAQVVEDFNFSLTPTSPGGAVQTVNPGQAATYTFNVAPVGGPFTFPVVLSATGLPTGATVTFTPQTVTLGSTATTFTMVIQTPASAMLHRNGLFGGSTMALALLLVLPFSRKLRRKSRKLTSLMVLLGLAALAGITGCGSGSGFFGQPQQTYTINVTGTATNPAGGSLSHTSPVTLVVE